MSRRVFVYPSDKYLSALRQYASQVRQSRKKPGSISPDATLLTNGLEEWLTSVASAEVHEHPDPRRRIAISLFKPSEDETTYRYCDPEFLYAAILHVVHGGSFLIQKNKLRRSYYWRIGVYKPAKSPHRDAYAMRLIVGTHPGQYTSESSDEFHDLTRATLGKLFRPGSKKEKAEYGRPEMIEWSLARFLEKPEHQICPTAEEYRRLMNEAYDWLELVPLGYGHSLAATSHTLPATP
jgi:hypothetical protein